MVYGWTGCSVPRIAYTRAACVRRVLFIASGSVDSVLTELSLSGQCAALTFICRVQLAVLLPDEGYATRGRPHLNKFKYDTAHWRIRHVSRDDVSGIHTPRALPERGRPAA